MNNDKQPILFSNAVIFDGRSEELVEGGFVLVRNGRIEEVGVQVPKSPVAQTIDCGGRFLMPGLIDLHFHAYSVSFDMHELDTMPQPLLTTYAAKHLRDTLRRGFTTVRDPGGGDVGLKLALDRGLIEGPRFLYGGKALSQTGGHGDMRNPEHREVCNCSYSGVICQLVDGVDEVRKATRRELHYGADHIKVFISGGVTSPSDPMWMRQFTDEELAAVVQEAETRRKYVVAHCHTDEGANRCVSLGIRSIDHATQISEATAKKIAASGKTYTVPTLAVVNQVIQVGREAGMHVGGIEKAEGATQDMLNSIETCRAAGVKIGFGTDIFGTRFHHMQSQEFRFRKEVDRPIDTLRSATSINAEICQMEGEIGIIEPGACADIILLETNPFEDVTVFERYEAEMPVIMKQGEIVKCLI